jgi:hypothetical protein
MLTVKHMCGHDQATNVDRLAAMAVQSGLRTQEEADQFVKDQVDWLRGHPCPECYRRAKGLRECADESGLGSAEKPGR